MNSIYKMSIIWEIRKNTLFYLKLKRDLLTHARIASVLVVDKNLLNKPYIVVSIKYISKYIYIEQRQLGCDVWRIIIYFYILINIYTQTSYPVSIVFRNLLKNLIYRLNACPGKFISLDCCDRRPLKIFGNLVKSTQKGLQYYWIYKFIQWI